MAASALSARPVPAPVAALVALALALGAAGCREDTPPAGAATEPVQAVAVLVAHLRANDLEGFARDAVPDTLHAPLAAAWRDGRSRWPLEELPFDQRIPGMLGTLAADGAEPRLRRSFDRQFANAHAEIRSAAEALSLFGVKYLQSDAALSPEERNHYVQLVEALGAWAGTAKLGDPKRARGTISRLAMAARHVEVREDADLGRLGMDESLRRLGPMFGALKVCLRDYDLDLDRSLDEMQLSLASREGDRALVRLRYPLAGRTIDTLIAVERVDGHWYLRDVLRHARAVAAPPPPTSPAAPAAPGAPPATPPATTPESAASIRPTSS